MKITAKSLCQKFYMKDGQVPRSVLSQSIIDDQRNDKYWCWPSTKFLFINSNLNHSLKGFYKKGNIRTIDQQIGICLNSWLRVATRSWEVSFSEYDLGKPQLTLLSSHLTEEWSWRCRRRGCWHCCVSGQTSPGTDCRRVTRHTFGISESLVLRF